MILLNTVVFDSGLSVITGSGTLKIAATDTQPTTLAEITNLSGAGGKRVSAEVPLTNDVDVFLENGLVADSRRLRFIQQNNVDVLVTAPTPSLYLVVYDATTIYITTDVIGNESLTNGGVMAFEEILITLTQPVQG